MKDLISEMSLTDKNLNKNLLIEKYTGFFFKHKEEEKIRNNYDNFEDIESFTLPEGIEKITILDKPLKSSNGNERLVSKKIYYTNGTKEVRELIAN